MRNQTRFDSTPYAAVFLFVLILAAAGRAAIADEAAAPAPDAPAAAPGDASPWRLETTMWIWLMGIEGDLGLGPISVDDINANFGDILDASDSLLALSGRVELGYGRFAVFADGIWAKIGVEDVSGPRGIASIDITMDMGVIDFGAMFRVYEGPLLGACQPTGTVSTIDLYAGARYFTLEIELDPARAATRSGDRDWFDPIVGVKLRQPLTRNLHLDLWGDVGGFGVESDLTWSATGVLGYDFEVFGIQSTVYGGYRAIGWDYDQGSGRDRFKWDIILHGPTLGLMMRF